MIEHGVDRVLMTTSNPTTNKIRRAMALRKKSEASKTYKIGDKIELIVPHCDPVVNLYDVIYGVRRDQVEVVWQVTGRGKSQ